MRIGDLTSWRPPHGRIGVVRPTPDAVERAGAAPVSPGPPSFLQGDHLRGFVAGQAAGRQHRAWTGTAGTVPLPLNRDALVRALTRLVRAQENLRCWFELDAEPVCHLVDPEAVEFAFTADESPAPTDAEWLPSLHTRMVEVYDEFCRPDRWAPFVLGVVEHPDSFSLFWGSDHAFTDGVSQLTVLDDLADLYRDEVGLGSVHPLIDAVPLGSFREHVAREYEAAANSADSPQVRDWCDLVAVHDGRLPASPLDLGLVDGQPAPAAISEVSLVEGDRMRALEKRCRADGLPVQAAVYAALGIATCALTGESDYYGVTVLATRDVQTARTFGWLCNFAPVSFPVPADGSACEVLGAAAEAVRRTKEFGEVPVHAALGAMLARGITTPERLGSPQMVSYLDMRRFAGAGGEPYDHGMHFTGLGRTANSSVWIQREDESLYAATIHPVDPTVRDRAVGFLRTVGDVLGQVAEGARVLEAGSFAATFHPDTTDPDREPAAGRTPDRGSYG